MTENAGALDGLRSLRTGEAQQSLGRLWPYLRPHRRTLLLAAVTTVVSAATGILIFYLIRYLLSDEVLAAPTVWEGLSHMLPAAALFLTVATIQLVFAFGSVFFLNQTALKLIRDLRAAMFRHLHTLSLSFYDRARTGELGSRLVNDTAILQYSLTTDLRNLLAAPVVIVVGLAMMFKMSWSVSLAALVIVPMVTFIIARLGRMIRKITAQTQEAIGSMQARVQESVSGIRTIKCFNLEAREAERFGRENQQVYRMGMRAARAIGVLQPLSEWIAAIGFIVVVMVGAFEIIRGRLSYGDFMALAAIVLRVGGNINREGRSLATLQQAAAIVDRIFEFLDMPSEVPDVGAPAEGDGTGELHMTCGEVRFEGISFSYVNGEEVLHNISFEAQAGQMVAVAGPSGSGKTTVVNLIPRLYQQARGCITIDGQDTAGVSLASVRSQIGVVSQDDFLFSGTIRENILVGRPKATDEEVEAAARAANAHEFIMGFPKGYDTVVGERGVTISGGQRQRITIARALLRNPRLLILDEATSALDAESEAQVYRNLAQWKGDRTVIIVAHRLSTLNHADKILVLDGGRLVEQGSHAELLAQKGLFASLHRLQVRQEEEVASDAF